MLGAPAERRHQVFVDDETSARKFDPAEYFETDESLLGRTYNRPRLSQLEAAELAPDSNEGPQTAERAQRYAHEAWTGFGCIAGVSSASDDAHTAS